MELLGTYQNGNYKVEIYNDGTKIRETEDNIFTSVFPECIDLKITDYCDMKCPYCHENSTVDGKHGNILNQKFINTLKPYTELAIGGGNPLSHPDLIKFLKILKSKNIIANITVNQKHFIDDFLLIEYLSVNNLVKGIGVSVNYINQELIEKLKSVPNIVLHVINGIVKLEDLKLLYNHDLKILILGYKEIRRGREYYNEQVETNKKHIYDNIREIANGFEVVSFDNLAIKQLKLQRIFSKKSWDEFYMGDDGQFTMYIDAVKEEFARNSTTMERHSLLEDITDMFQIVKRG